MLAACLALAGGLLALWALRLRRRFELPAVVGWAALYAVFVGDVVADA